MRNAFGMFTVALAIGLAGCGGTTSKKGTTTSGSTGKASTTGVAGSTSSGHGSGSTTTSASTGVTGTTGTTGTSATTGTTANTGTTATTGTVGTTGTTSTTATTGTTGTTSTTGSGPVGAACATDATCAPGFCVPATDADGGATGWTNGYCTADCGVSPAICGGEVCVDLSNGSFCEARCPAPGQGRSTCRTDYACFFYDLADGGLSTDGVCAPSCAAPGASCSGGYVCDAQGYCGNAPMGSGLAGAACTADAQCGQGGAFCNPGTFDDGGAGYWPGGSCSEGCAGEPSGFCGAGGTCATFTDGSYCEASCTTPGAGQTTCRSGYACFSYGLPDGGTSTDGICFPDCREPGWECTGGFVCNAQGYCDNAPLGNGVAGAACGQDSQCGPGGAYCRPSTFADGGAGYWPGGYCSQTCTGEPSGFCGAGGTCVTYDPTFSACEESCPSPGGGQANCRSSYECFYYGLADGGLSSDGICSPGCSTPGWSCNTGYHCGAQGYCDADPLVAGEAGRTCSASTDCGPSGGGYCVTSWPSGYCSAECTNQPDSFCGDGHCSYSGANGYCEQACSTPWTGRGGCRSGYTCYAAYLPSGAEDTSRGVCEPDCTTFGCPSGSSCNTSDGYCY